MTERELDWISQKASELLLDKVCEAPLTDRDIELAFEIFAKPRLQKLAGGKGYERAADQIMEKLRERARELNDKHWREKAIDLPRL